MRDVARYEPGSLDLCGVWSGLRGRDGEPMMNRARRKRSRGNSVRRGRKSSEKKHWIMGKRRARVERARSRRWDAAVVRCRRRGRSFEQQLGRGEAAGSAEADGRPGGQRDRGAEEGAFARGTA